MDPSTPCLVLAFAIIPALTVVAYRLAARSERAAADDEALTTFEGTIVSIAIGSTSLGSERGVRLVVRPPVGAVVEIAAAEPSLVAGLLIGQRVRVRGAFHEEPTVDGEIHDLRQPPASRRVLRATALEPLPTEPAGHEPVAYGVGLCLAIWLGTRFGLSDGGSDLGTLVTVAAVLLMVWMVAGPSAVRRLR